MQDLSLDVLIIGRSRPIHLRRLLNSEALRDNAIIYLFLDGVDVNESDTEEISNILETQRIAQEFMKDNPERLLIWPTKLGCYLGVTTAIDWFFQHVEKGLILEDDLIAHPNIVPLAKKALSSFEHVENIGSINFYRTETNRLSNHFVLSNYPNSWGWATWKSRWLLFDHRSPQKIWFQPWKISRHGGLTGLRRWYHVIGKIRRKNLDTWAYRWQFMFWLKNLNAITFPFNLIENCGFGESATHTKIGVSAKISTECDASTLDWAIESLQTDKLYDRIYLQNVLGVK